MSRARAIASEEERRRLQLRAEENRRRERAQSAARPAQQSPGAAIGHLEGSSHGVEVVEEMQRSSGNTAVQRSIESAREEEARNNRRRGRPDRSAARERERGETEEQEARPSGVSMMTGNVGEEYNVEHAPTYIPGTVEAEMEEWQNDPQAGASMAARRLEADYIDWLGDPEACRAQCEIPATWYLTTIPESEWSLNDWIERRAQGQAIDRLRLAPIAAEYAVNIGKLVKDVAEEGVEAVFSFVQEEAIKRIKIVLKEMGMPEEMIETLDELGQLVKLAKDVIGAVKAGNPASAGVLVLEFVLDLLTPEQEELPSHLDDSGWWGSVARTMPQRIYFYNNVVYNESNLREFLTAQGIDDENVYRAMRELTDDRRREEVPVPERGLQEMLKTVER